MADPSPSPEDVAITAERIRLVRESLNALTRVQRATVTAFYIDELSPDSVCDRMGFSKTRLYRVLAESRFRIEARLRARGISSAWCLAA